MKNLQKLFLFLRSIFGEFRFDWNPPLWWRKAADKIVASDPKRAMKIGGSVVVAALVIGVGTWQYLEYLERQPKPSYVKVNVIAPGPTDPETKFIQKVTVYFSSSAATLKDLNREISQGVEISPAVPGAWKWESDRTLTFTPAQDTSKFDWPAGSQYTISFKRTFFPGHLKFESYSHVFVTHPLELKFAESEFHIDPQNPKNKRVVATLRSNYPLEPEEFKKKITFEYQPKDASVLGKRARQFPFGVTFNPYFTEAYVQSDPIQLPKENHVMLIKVAKGSRSSRGGKPLDEDRQMDVDVAGLYEAFKVESASVEFARNEKFEPEQVFILETAIDARSEDIAQALEVYLLPAEHTPPGAKRPVKNYYWNSPGEFNEAVRGASQKVELKLVPSENTFSKTHSFKVTLPVERSLFVRLKKGVRGIGEYELGADYARTSRVPDYTPELQFMSDGSMLSLGGDKKLPLLARAVEEVEFEIARVIPAQVNHLIARLAYSPSFSKPWMGGTENMIAERFKLEQKLTFKSRAETVYFSLDLEPYVRDGRGFFMVKARSKNGSTTDERLILITDLGIVAKENSSRSTEIFVQNVRSGAPVGDAVVEVVGQNGIGVLSVTTDGQGRAQFPNLKDYQNERKPIAFLVRKGGDASYLPYQLSNRELRYSRFDVDGVQESSESDALSAMLFSDRGIYRPGDKVNLGVILRSKAFKSGTPELPMQWTVTDPRGSVIRQEKFRASSFGLVELGFKTEDTSPTGDYQAQVSIVKKRGDQEYTEQLGSLSVRIEEFVPDQLKITATLEPFRTSGWVPLGKIKTSVKLLNLFGTPAENRGVESAFTLIPVSPYVPAYKEHRFANPNRADARTTTQEAMGGKTDASGVLTGEIDLSQYDGYFQLRYVADGYQAAGGRSVTASASVAVSSLPYLIGWKADGDLGFINRAGERTVNLVAVDPSHQSIETQGLKLVLVERRYVSSLMKQDNGTFKYQSVRKDYELKEEALTIRKGGNNLKLPTSAPGDFAYLLRDESGRELNRVEFGVVGDSNLTRSLDRAAELQLVLNKTDYQPGEEIEIQIRSPYTGSGLITIERDSVYAHKWFRATNTNVVEKIRIPAGLEGNAYINVAFLRGIDSREIFMSPLSYGVQPFSISLDRHRTKITLKAPEKVKPGQTLKIQYSADRPTQLVLYGVDEGILQVAGYKLPDPLKHFFRKKSLQVRTFQLLDQLLPEYSVIQDMAAPGGDGSYDAIGKNLNPFKRKDQPPVTFWSGVLKADAAARTFTYVVPEYYNGNIKLMAVASSELGLGSIESGALSRGDFVISPTVPLFASPGDEFVVGVNVSNQVEGANPPTQLTIKVASSEHVQSIGPASQTLDVEAGREKALDFRIKANPKLGSGEIRFEVTGGGKSARLTTSLSVRPALPYMTSLKMGVARSLPLDLEIDRKRLPEFRKTELDASVVPLSLGKGLVSYLDGYPYICTEQLVSRALPSMVFRGRPEFDFDPKKAREHHEDIIALLRTRQSSGGGFTLYAGQEGASAPASLYAFRYLIEADARGFALPEDLRARMNAYLKSGELRRTETLTSARLFAEAIYLQARSHLVPTNDLNFLREALDNKHKGKWEKDAIAAYLAGTYALLKQEEKGQQLLRKLELGDSTVRDYDAYYDGMVRDAIVVQIAGRHYPEQLKRLISGDGLEKLVKPLQQGQFNTYSSAQTLLAMDSILASAEKAGFPGELLLEEIVGGQAKPLAFARSLIAHARPAEEATAVRISASGGGAAKFPVFYSLNQQGFDRDLPTVELKKGLEISRVFLKADSPVSKVKLGEEITVSLRARALDGDFGHLVLVDLFPAGFEQVLESRTESRGEGEPESDPEHSIEPDSEPESEPDSAEDGAFLRGLLFSTAFAQSNVSLRALHVNFSDFREDRVVVYGSASRDLGEFTYRLKAVNRGKFVVPPAFGESMYDRTIQYRGTAQSIEVE